MKSARSIHTITIAFFVLAALPIIAQEKLADSWKWRVGPPVVSAKDVGGITCHSIKDPTIVRFQDRWHLFCTIRGKERSHAIVYQSFVNWEDADGAPRHVLPMHTGYFCAPQVFYFTPHKRWYLICQASKDEWEPKYQPAFSTSEDISDPNSWSPLQPLYNGKPDNLKGWIDFWVIADETKAHLFFTSNDGNFWRSETPLDQFPKQWTQPVLALRDDIFEASHTYRIRGQQKFLSLIEAQGGNGWRYYKAYVADSLDGQWQPLAATRDHAFASLLNVTQPAERWTDSISHGELLRDGFDERMEIDPDRLQFLFQGVLDRDRQGKSYGEIPWRLGILVGDRAP